MAVADFSRINSNIAALNSLNSLNNVNKQLGMHQLRLATGRRINSAEDDPAGLTIATKFRSRNENIKTAIDNIGQGKNMLSVAEGGLNKVQDILVTMRKKAEEAANDTLGVDERDAIENQLAEFAKEVDDIVEQTTWNGNKLLDGLTDFDSFEINFQTGAGTGITDTTTLTSAQFNDISVNGGGLSALADVAATSSIEKGTLASGGVTTTTATAGFTLSNQATMTSGLSELSTGSYTIRMTITNTNDAAGGTIQVLNEAGNVMSIDNGSGVQALSRTFSTTASAAVNLDLGNGLNVAFNSDIFTVSGGTAVLGLDYTRQGDYTVSLNTNAEAVSYMDGVDSAIKTISSRLQTLGSLASRLTLKEENLGSAQINTEAAYNRIMNADMAMSQMEATKFQILQQTATTMLAQANQAPQGLLSLFR